MPTPNLRTWHDVGDRKSLSGAKVQRFAARVNPLHYKWFDVDIGLHCHCALQRAAVVCGLSEILRTDGVGDADERNFRDQPACRCGGMIHHSLCPGLRIGGAAACRDSCSLPTGGIVHLHGQNYGAKVENHQCDRQEHQHTNRKFYGRYGATTTTGCLTE